MHRSATRKWIDLSEQVALTEVGRNHYGELEQRVAAASGPLYADLAPVDLAVTERILDEVARRARVALAEIS